MNCAYPAKVESALEFFMQIDEGINKKTGNL
jgi:hypothetical protein